MELSIYISKKGYGLLEVDPKTMGYERYGLRGTALKHLGGSTLELLSILRYSLSLRCMQYIVARNFDTNQ